MKLSIVIPNYNHGHRLRQCTRALQNALKLVQPEIESEIIVVDDCSTDNSLEIGRQLVQDKQINYLLRELKNRGPTSANNVGLEFASGEFVFFTAADDEVLPEFFKRSFSALSFPPGAGLSCTQSIWRRPGLEWIAGRGAAGYVGPEFVDKYFISTNTVIYRRSVMGRQRTEFGCFSDAEMVYRIGRQHGIMVVPEPLAIANLNPTGFYQKNKHAIPAFAEIAIKEDAFPLHLLGPEAFSVMLEHGKVTPKYMWHCARVLANRKLPDWLIRAYVKLGGSTL